MKKIMTVIILSFVVLVLGACEKKNDANTITVGASYVPHAEILEQARPLLKEKGYNLKIVTYQDYILPNQNLTEGELDANFFQHIPYLNLYNSEHNTDIVNAGGIHIEPIGMYSRTYTDLKQVTDETTVIMSNSISDKPRLLTLLVEEGLLNLDLDQPLEDVNIKSLENDSVANPKGLSFRNDIDPGLLVTTYKNESNVIVLINTNYALDGGLVPSKDALVLETGTVNNPYVNIIATNREDLLSDKIQALVEVLKSEPIKNYITTEYQGAVIPAN